MRSNKVQSEIVRRNEVQVRLYGVMRCTVRLCEELWGAV